MTTAVTGFILLAIVVAAIFGIAAGLDPVALILLAVICVLGALSIAITRRMRTSGIGPISCAECGGAISPTAPYCKHCNAPR
jgi:presenilin-like A22 family membrane protease